MPRQTKRDRYALLLDAAREAAGHAYCPYSGYSVGAAVLTWDGQIYTGCNVENATYTLTVHAEVAAATAAIAGGALKRCLAAGRNQGQLIKAVACVCLKTFETWHCALCRQFLCEFGVEMDIVVPRADGTALWKPLKRLLKHPFVPPSCRAARTAASTESNAIVARNNYTLSRRRTVMLHINAFRRTGLSLVELLVCAVVVVILGALLFSGGCGQSLPPAPFGSSLPANYFEVVQQPGFVTSLDVNAGGSRYGSVTRQGSFWTTFQYEDSAGSVRAKAWITTEGWGKKVVVQDGSGRDIGSLKKEYWQSGFGTTVYTVFDGAGREVAKSEKEDWWATSITLKDSSGRVIARLDRPSRGFGGDCWTVTVMVPNVVDHRVLIMIAAFKTNADK